MASFFCFLRLRCLGLLPFLALGCGGLFATTSTARSKRCHASGSNSTSLMGFFAMPDTTEQSIYVAVGQALTKWETLECHLSYMYSIFAGKPVDHIVLEQYGEDGPIFKERMLRIEAAAKKYFISCPNQAEEGRADCFIAEARRLANFRHRIAHGMVIGLETEDGIIFRLVPPSHGYFHLTKRDGDYAYSSEQIDGYTKEFLTLASKVQKFNHERHLAK